MMPAGPTVEGAGGTAPTVHASTVWLPRRTVAPSVCGAAVFGVSRRAGAGWPLSRVSSVHTACAVATLDSSLPPGSAISRPTVVPVRPRKTVRGPCGLPPAILTSRAELQHGRSGSLVPIRRSRSEPSNARSRTVWLSGTRTRRAQPAVLAADRRITLRLNEWSSLKTPYPSAVCPPAENASWTGSTSSEYGPPARNGACQLAWAGAATASAAASPSANVSANASSARAAGRARRGRRDGRPTGRR